MSAAVRSRVAWGIAIASTALAFAWKVLEYITPGASHDDPSLGVISVAAVISFGVIGATIASRTGNPVGWAMLSVVGTFGVFVGFDGYATYAFVTVNRHLPLDTFAAWIATLSFFLALALIVTIPLLYPTGTPRWRWLWRVYLTATTVLIAGFAILPQDLSLSVGEGPPNPYAIDAWENVVGPALAVAGLTIFVCGVLSIVALILRYRASQGDERQQIRWLAWVGVSSVVLLFVNAAVSERLAESSSKWDRFLGLALSDIWFAVIFLGIPAACGIAILKYHLYDLDVVIRKTVVAGAMALFIALVYAAVVGGIGALVGSSGNTTLSFVAAVALALLFQPARDRARRFADRVVYGKRATPYEVLAEFSGHVGEAYATEDVLPRMAQVLANGTGASSVKILLRVGTELREAAAVGETAAGDEHTVPVVDRGEELGALAVTLPANDPMNPAKDKLVQDLASQAGLVLRNVRLIEELRGSRQRLVAAQDEERRKIERNIHDGVQQQLVALAVKLRMTKALVSKDPAGAERTLDDLQAATTEALEDLRDLARGIYPPLLADQGLAAALQAQARKSPIQVSLDADGIGRFPKDVESAVYFCVLEALNNVAKYAGASRATVRLMNGAGWLQFEVNDDGAGFDQTQTGYGTGLQGMADRLDAIGGALTVASSPGAGTTIGGVVPTEATTGGAG
jgi:signal transduction histidine kinase